MASSPHDVVVFGATSFVGQILARCMFDEFGVDGSPSWAIAGRSASKLESVRQGLGPEARRLPVIEADAGDEASLRRLCERARVVVSTVGPYALHGEPLVRACADTGTDYCDLAGEPQWLRRMISKYDETARASGARLVPCCGFDSIPFDLGVHFLQRHARERFGEPCREVKTRVRSMRGGFSGGTAASIVNLLKEVGHDPALRRELNDPYSLCPPGEGPRVRQRDLKFAAFDRDFDSWIAPFVMAAINTRIVHRTNALTRHAYGPGFHYEEAVLTGRGLKGRFAAVSLATGLGAFMAAGSLAPTRRALERLLPPPGTGPSPEAQRNGHFDVRFLGRTADGRVLRTRVTGDRDPGYGSTARMLAQAAACLALDVPRSRARGFWTPAALFGDALVDRLQRHAGVTFDLLD